MTRSQMAIAETIDAFYGDSGANDGVSRSYKQAVADLDAETIKALDGPYRYAPFTIPGSSVANRIELLFSSRFQGSAPTSPTSTNVCLHNTPRTDPTKPV